MCHSVSDIIWIYLLNFWFTIFVFCWHWFVRHLARFILMPFCNCQNGFEFDLSSLSGRSKNSPEFSIKWKENVTSFIFGWWQIIIICFSPFFIFVCRVSILWHLAIYYSSSIVSIVNLTRIKLTPFRLSVEFYIQYCVLVVCDFFSFALVMPILCLQFSFLCVYSKQKDLLIYNSKAKNENVKRISNLVRMMWIGDSECISSPISVVVAIIVAVVVIIVVSLSHIHNNKIQTTFI